MKLLICTGMGESEWCTNHALTWTFRQLGIEVVSCGPQYSMYENHGKPDIEIADRPFPERWTYKEVLDLCPWTPDFILQIVPHFYLTGPKPKGVKSGFYCTDQHATGMMFKRGAEWGNFDYLFVGQPAYRHFFLDLAPVVTTILPAFDERRFDQSVNAEPKFDISFVGMSGLSLTGEHWNSPDGEDEAGKYITNLKYRLPNDQRKYACANVPSYDYASRAELLYRLSGDFNVRICEPLWDTRIQSAIQKGRIGFGRSLNNDISIRTYEVAASGRLIVTDNVRGLGNRPGVYPKGAFLYESDLFKPFYENFDLEYKACIKEVEKALRSSEEDKDLACVSREDVFSNHSWTARAKDILRTVNLG